MATKELTIKENGKEMKVFIPGADQMDRHELEDIVQWQTEKTRDELRKAPPKEESKHSKKEVGEALKDYRDFQQRRGQGGKKYY